MAKSIKLGDDTYLDASGVVGIRGTISSGDDLNNYVGRQYSGMWYIGASSTAISNCPSGYSGLISITAGSVAFQMIFARAGIYYRDRTGNPTNWSHWFRVTGTDTGA